MRVFLTGASGMLGSAIRRLNESSGGALDICAPRRAELNLADQAAVGRYMERGRFDLVVHAAAKVGGIGANIADPAGFLTENLALNLAVIDSAVKTGVQRLLNIGSSCMYPKDYRQPLVETDLLQAPLEPTNEGYALAKIVAARHCAYISQNGSHAFRTIIPCNLYGPNDTYTPAHSHLVASMIAKVHAACAAGAPAVTIWGDGTARREFLFVDDLAQWIVKTAAPNVAALPQYLNVGAGLDHTIEEYYRIGAAVIGFEGDFEMDATKPVGMRQKLMDSSLAFRFGWAPSTSLNEGIRRAYEAYVETL
jgi:GDP-L-fucose synthase